MINDARVLLWGTSIGAVTWLEDRERAVFQYDPDFAGSGIEARVTHTARVDDPLPKRCPSQNTRRPAKNIGPTNWARIESKKVHQSIRR